jgi:hypothetical protein
MVSCGALLLEVKPECTSLEYWALLHKHDIAERTARQAIQFAGDPGAHEKAIERKRDRRAETATVRPRSTQSAQRLSRNASAA